MKMLGKALLMLMVCIGILILLGDYIPQRGHVSMNDRDVVTPASGHQMGPVGIKKAYLNKSSLSDNSSPAPKHFITLHNLYIKPKAELDGAIYTIEHNTPVLLKKNQKKNLGFYFDPESDKPKGGVAKLCTTLMFPVSKSIYSFGKIAWLAFIALAMFCTLWIFIGGLIKFIEQIARGNAFTNGNIKILRNIAYINFAIPLIGIVSNILIWFILKLKYPGYFCLNPSIYFFHARIILIGLFFFALYCAFKKGYSIQQENDLTV